MKRPAPIVPSYFESTRPAPPDEYEHAGSLCLVIQIADAGIHAWRATTKNYPDLSGVATTRDGAIAQLLVAIARKKGACEPWPEPH